MREARAPISALPFQSGRACARTPLSPLLFFLPPATRVTLFPASYWGPRASAAPPQRTAGCAGCRSQFREFVFPPSSIARWRIGAVSSEPLPEIAARHYVVRIVGANVARQRRTFRRERGLVAACTRRVTFAYLQLWTWPCGLFVCVRREDRLRADNGLVPPQMPPPVLLASPHFQHRGF